MAGKLSSSSLLEFASEPLVSNTTGVTNVWPYHVAKNLQVQKVWFSPKIPLMRGDVMDILGRAPIDETHG